MQNSAPNSNKCSKGAQRNRERPNPELQIKKFPYPEKLFEDSQNGVYENRV